jgi:hypothetical protein
MKKALLTGLLGVALTATTYGQGMVHFSNYFSSSSPAWGVDGSNAGAGNLGMGPTWSAQLLYYIGSTTDASMLQALSYTSGGNTSPVDFGFGVATADGDLGSGWFDGGFVQIPGVTAANAGTITFQIMVSHNGTPTYLSSLFESAVSADSASGAPNFVQGAWQTTPLSPVPEPTTLALLGIGGAALLVFRRKNA